MSSMSILYILLNNDWNAAVLSCSGWAELNVGFLTLNNTNKCATFNYTDKIKYVRVRSALFTVAVRSVAVKT